MVDHNQLKAEGKPSAPIPSPRGELPLACWRSVVQAAGGDAALVHQVLVCREAGPGEAQEPTVEELAEFVGLTVSAAQVALWKLVAVGLVDPAGWRTVAR